VDVDGHNDRELLPEYADTISNQSYPCFSSDGRQLLIAGGPLEPEGRPWLNLYSIYVCDIDIVGQASNVRQLPILSTESVCPRWSPSGDRIAYMTESGELRSVSIENGEETTIARGIDTPDFGLQSLDWSPNGEWLSYVASFDGCCELWKIRSNGSDRTCVLTDEFLGAPRWSPDGHWLAFSGTGGVGVIRPDGTGRRPVTGSNHSMAQEYCPTWSRDSSSIFCLSNRDGGADLYRVDLVPPLAAR
jgi:Tol biopolymer transport system component